MVRRPFSSTSPVTWAINVPLSHGRLGARARIEWHADGDGCWAVLAVDGWIERIGLKRLSQLLDQLSQLGARRLLLDGARLRYIDFTLIPGLVRSLAPYDAPHGHWMVCGLSAHVEDLFRLAGLGSRMIDRSVPSPTVLAPEAECETAS